jgi:hypothetical protein
MSSATPLDQRLNIYERAQFRSEPEELTVLRAENKRLGELVVQLSKIAIKNVIDRK